MKKLIYLVVILFVFASLTSCASKKKGCGLTADNNTVPSQEIVVADINQ
jgi:hypothetical protein